MSMDNLNYFDEEWRDIKGYEGFYQVSNYGRVKSLGNGKSWKSGKILKEQRDKDGYAVLYLTINKRTLKRVHQLVAYAFPEICGERFEGCHVDHINGEKTDNRALNLRVCTCKENINNPITLKRKSIARKGHKLKEETKIKISNSLKGVKLSEEHRNNIKEGHRNKCGKCVLMLSNGVIIKEFRSISEASEETGICLNNIQQTCSKKRRSAGGYEWQYK